MRLLDLLHNGVVFLRLCLVHGILMINADDRTVRRDLDDIHPVNVPELLFLRQRRTSHAGFFVVFIEKILEGDRRQRAALPLDLDMLLGLDRLMQAVRIPPSGHDPPCKGIHDQHLLIPHNIVLIPMHQIMRPQRQDHIVLDLQIVRIGKIVDLKEPLNLLDTSLCQIDGLFLLADDKISRLLLHDTHDGIHLGVFWQILPAL